MSFHSNRAVAISNTASAYFISQNALAFRADGGGTSGGGGGGGPLPGGNAPGLGARLIPVNIGVRLFPATDLRSFPRS